MDADQEAWTPAKQEELRRHLCVGHGTIRLWRRFCRVMPSAPRCRLCYAPFGGIGGKLYSLAGFAPSRKNPLVCNT